MKQVETVKLLFRASHFEILQFLPFSACRETEPGLRMQLPEAPVVDVEAVSSQRPCMFLLSGATVEEADGRTGSIR